MIRGLTRGVSSRIADGEITFIGREPIDDERIVQQHEAYCAVLRTCGVALKELASSDAYPDSCFVEDTAIVLDELAIITSMGCASRRGETVAIEPELRVYREVIHMGLPATIEGGDVLRVGKTLFVGLSSRTNELGIAALAELLTPFGYEVVPIMVRAGSLHLKTACTSIDEETLLLNPQWVDPDAFGRFRVLWTPEDEPWAANVLRLGETLCLNSDCPKTAERVQRLHGKITWLDISEFRKAEAGLSCLSILFEDA